MNLAPPKPLSRRQSQVLKLRLEGRSHREIAEEFGITVDVVKHHQTDALWRLGVDSIFELACLYYLPLNHPANPISGGIGKSGQRCAENKLPRIVTASSHGLSARDLEMLHLLADGNSYPAMAGKLGITAKTAKVYGSLLLQKLGADNAAQAVAMAIRRKIIE